MKPPEIVCASSFEENHHPTPDLLVLPERVPITDLEAATCRWPDTIVVGAVSVDRHVRAYVLHGGINQIDYLKFSPDGVSDGILQPPRSQTYKFNDLIVGVLICKDFQQTDILATVMRTMKDSKATKKVLCIPADMASEWFPSEPIQEFLGTHVALSNNIRTPSHTRRKSFILTPDGIAVKNQINHEAISLNAA